MNMILHAVRFAMMALSVAFVRGEPPAEPPRAAPVAGVDRFRERLERVDEAIGKVGTLRAEFSQTKKTPLLKKPIISSGVLLSKGSKVLWRTTSPRPSELLVSPEGVMVHYPQDKLIEQYPADERMKHSMGGPLPRLEDLRRQFSLGSVPGSVITGAAADDSMLGVELVPLTPELARHVSRVRVLIDESIPCANLVEIVDGDGEVTRIRFRSVRLDVPVSDDDVNIHPEPGTRISKPLEGTVGDAAHPASGASPKPDRDSSSKGSPRGV